MPRIERKSSTMSVFHSGETSATQEMLPTKNENMFAPKDEFVVGVGVDGLKPDQFRKIAKACRIPLESLHVTEKGELQFLHQFAPEKIELLQRAEAKAAREAYLEGIYVVERYVALVNHGSACETNANRVMDEYLAYIDTHSPYSKKYESKLYWFKSDYRAGTDDENLIADAELVQRASKFFSRLKSLAKEKDGHHIQKKLNKMVSADQNPLVASIAIRRIIVKGI